MKPEHGPIYGVELIDTLPLGTGGMLQAMPSRSDLIQARVKSERTVAGYEVLLDHYREKCKRVEELEAIIKQHDLCHNLHGKVDAQSFADGCAEEQRKLYGSAPDRERVEELKAENAKLREALVAVYPEEEE